MLKSAPVQAAADASSDHRADRSREVDYLEVVGHASFVVNAEGTRLTLTVEAETLVADDAALTRVEELRTLRDAMSEAGGDTRLLAVEGRAKSGLLGTSTEARYTVEVASPTAKLADVMLGVARHKASTLIRSAWSYPDVDTRIDDAAAEATKRARRRAATMAEALGCELGAPFCVLLDHQSSDENPAPVAKLSKSAGVEDRRVRLASQRTVRVEVLLRYRLPK